MVATDALSRSSGVGYGLDRSPRFPVVARRRASDLATAAPYTAAARFVTIGVGVPKGRRIR